jgi:hypothetical protein
MGDCVLFCCRRALHKVMALSRKYCYLGASRSSCKRFIAHEFLVVSVCVLEHVSVRGSAVQGLHVLFLLLLNAAVIYCKIYWKRIVSSRLHYLFDMKFSLK